MPNLSGLHISRTTSSGHSSRSSSSMSVSSGKRFLANSLRDFTLSFRVFCASIETSLCGNAARFTDFTDQFRQEFQEVVHDSDIGHLEDRGLRVFVDSDDERIAFDTREVLERSADAARHINLGLHGLAGGTNLP